MGALAWTSALLVVFLASQALGQEEEKPTEEGMWCFQCHSDKDPDCDDLTKGKMSTYYKSCNETDSPDYWRKADNDPRPYFCRKIVQTIHDLDGRRVVIRKCGWVPHQTNQSCYSVSNVGHKDVVCQCFEPGCNPAVHHTPFYLLLLAALLGLRFL